MYHAQNVAFKSIPLNALPDSAWTYITGKNPNEGEYGIDTLIKRVPWLFRAEGIRAEAIANLPRAYHIGDADGEEVTDADVPIKFNADELLNIIERHLFRYGAAYLYLEKNELGQYMRDGKLRKVRFWHPSSVTPLYSEVDGLVGFERKTGNKTTKYKPEDVIYFWLPNADTEIGPGTPESTAALYAAGVLHNIDRYAESYFGNGAVNPTLLAVEGPEMLPADRERLQSWYRRMLSGVKNAFRLEIATRKVTPVQIGYAPKDLATTELTNSKREDVATATGVPHSLLFSNAANYATAKMDTLNFYDMSIKPRAKLIFSILNERLFNPLGYHLAAHPERLEIYQELQAQSADAVVSLKRGGIMTVKEAREHVNLPPEPDGELHEEMPPPVMAPNAAPEPPPRAQNAPAATDTPEDAANAKSAPLCACGKHSSEADCLTDELKKWEVKARKRIKEGKPEKAADFDSAVIPATLKAAIAGALSELQSVDDVGNVFTHTVLWANYP